MDPVQTVAPALVDRNPAITRGELVKPMYPTGIARVVARELLPVGSAKA